MSMSSESEANNIPSCEPCGMKAVRSAARTMERLPIEDYAEAANKLAAMAAAQLIVCQECKALRQLTGPASKFFESSQGSVQPVSAEGTENPDTSANAGEGVANSIDQSMDEGIERLLQEESYVLDFVRSRGEQGVTSSEFDEAMMHLYPHNSVFTNRRIRRNTVKRINSRPGPRIAHTGATASLRYFVQEAGADAIADRVQQVPDEEERPNEAEQRTDAPAEQSTALDLGEQALSSAVETESMRSDPEPMPDSDPVTAEGELNKAAEDKERGQEEPADAADASDEPEPTPEEAQTDPNTFPLTNWGMTITYFDDEREPEIRVNGYPLTNNRVVSEVIRVLADKPEGMKTSEIFKAMRAAGSTLEFEAVSNAAKRIHDLLSVYGVEDNIAIDKPDNRPMGESRYRLLGLISEEEAKSNPDFLAGTTT